MLSIGGVLFVENIYTIVVINDRLDRAADVLAACGAAFVACYTPRFGLTVLRLVREAHAAEQRERVEAVRREGALIKADFLAVMSHELRTPLNVILGYSELLQDGIPVEIPGPAKEELRRIDVNAQKLLSIVSSMLDYAQLEAGQLRVESTVVLLDDVVARVYTRCASHAEERNIRLLIQGPSYMFVSADERRLQQVLENLVTNAIKFTPPGGTVAIDRTCFKSTCEVTVADSGPGIPIDKWSEVFDPFTMLDRSLTRSTGGTGIGLSISRTLVQRMGGRLDVLSLPQLGAVFTVSLLAA